MLINHWKNNKQLDGCELSDNVCTVCGYYIFLREIKIGNEKICASCIKKYDNIVRANGYNTINGKGIE